MFPKQKSLNHLIAGKEKRSKKRNIKEKENCSLYRGHPP